MHTETLTDQNCFETLAAEWHDLLSRSITNQVFITPEFLNAWWTTLSEGKLNLVTVRNEHNELVGIAPMYIFVNVDQKKEMRFIGCVDVSDYLDFIVDQNFADEVYHAVGEYLTAMQEIDTAFFCSIPERSLTLTVFQENMSKKGWKTEQKQQDVCPVIELPKSWDEYLGSIGKKQRHEIKRKWEKLFKEQEAEFELIELPTETDSAITDFILLHQASSKDKKNFWNEEHVQFFKYFAQKTAESKWLKLYFLKISGIRVATMLGFEYNHQFYLYNSGYVSDNFREYGIGSVLTAYTIQQAIERGNTRYDFLRGDEEYKFRFKAVAEPVFDLHFSR
ncbi:hypothetical protein BH10PAT2_BH10PAT2_1250 [soil metagenome]